MMSLPVHKRQVLYMERCKSRRISVFYHRGRITAEITDRDKAQGFGQLVNRQRQLHDGPTGNHGLISQSRLEPVVTCSKGKIIKRAKLKDKMNQTTQSIVRSK